MITVYSPPGIHTAGMSRIVVCPSMGDIEAPTVEEIESGIAIECALEEYGVAPKPQVQEIVPFGDGTGILALATSTGYDTLTLTATMKDPQAGDPLLALLARGSVVWLVHRPGVEHDAPITPGELVQVTMARVTSRTLSPLSTDDGDEYQLLVSLAVQDTTDLLVPIAS